MKNICFLMVLLCAIGCTKSETIKQNIDNPVVVPPVINYGEGKIIVCGSNRINIIDLKKSTAVKPDIVWQWIASEDTTLPLIYRQVYITKIDECKQSTDGKRILMTSSSGGIAIINIADKKVLFYAYVPNAHSIEELPNNKIAVISSIHTLGNAIDIYDTNQLEKSLYRTSFYSGHGLFWHRSEKVLYALGGKELRTYELVNWQTNSPSLNLINNANQPGGNGHDLRPVADSSALIITDENNSYLFNIKAKTFSTYSPLSSKKDVKSVDINRKDGRVLYVTPEESWWAFHVRILNPVLSLPVPDMNIYKARWFDN